MDKRRIFVEIFFVILVIFLQHSSASFDGFDDEDDDASWNRCPWIRNKLKNGRVKIRSRGRIAKFQCDSGYDLAGKRFATCVRGQWNNPIPVCVARGCPRRPNVPNSRVTELFRGALLTFDCLPGYKLQGGSTIYCDGRRWNAGTPVCEALTSDPQMTCDFESTDLCGWSHDPTHDFDWKRNQFSTPSGHVGTGPSFDHTYGVGKGGFYLYMEASSPRKQDDTARLFSPVYPKDYSGGCFVFWYHMYGQSTGGLKVYVKPESHVFGEFSPSWELFGDQGNEWFQGNVTVPQLSENFQIVIEGIRGNGYVGDTAIDDVSLNHGDCESIGNSSESIPEFNLSSCRGRCREEIKSEVCYCGDTCVSEENCCQDYQLLCTAGPETDETESPDEQARQTSTRITPLIISSESSFDVGNISSSTAYSSTQISSLSNTTLPATDVKPLYTSSESFETTSYVSTASTSVSNTVPSSTTSATVSTSIANATVSSTTISITSIPVTQAPITLTTEPTTQIPTTSTTPFPTTTKSTTTSTPIPTSSEASTTPSIPIPTTKQTTTTFSTTTTTIAIPTVPVDIRTVPSSKQSTEDVFIVSLPYVTTPKTTTSSKSTTEKYSTTKTLPTTPYDSPETRRTYHLRPRNRTTTTPSTTVSMTPLPPYSELTSYIPRTRPTFPSTTFTTTSSRLPFLLTTQRTAVPSISTLVTSVPSYFTRVFPLAVTTSSPPTTTSTPRSRFKLTTEDMLSYRDAHPSKAASAAADEKQSVVTIVSVTLVVMVCFGAALLLVVRRWRASKRAKLAGDSEMRFLAENEVIEFSDASVLDRHNLNQPLI